MGSILVVWVESLSSQFLHCTGGGWRDYLRCRQPGDAVHYAPMDRPIFICNVVHTRKPEGVEVSSKWQGMRGFFSGRATTSCARNWRLVLQLLWSHY